MGPQTQDVSKSDTADWTAGLSGPLSGQQQGHYSELLCGSTFRTFAFFLPVPAVSLPLEILALASPSLDNG